jgi:putative hemolysin
MAVAITLRQHAVLTSKSWLIDLDAAMQQNDYIAMSNHAQSNCAASGA